MQKDNNRQLLSFWSLTGLTIGYQSANASRSTKENSRWLKVWLKKSCPAEQQV